MTDRVKLGWFSILVIVLFPLVLYELLVVRQISSVPDHLLDEVPARMVILDSPQDMVLGVKSAVTGSPLSVLVANSKNLPVQDSQVLISLVSRVPEPGFDFCSGIITGSSLDERLGAVCDTALHNEEKSTNASGMATLDDFALVAGVPGTYIMNVTVSKVRTYTDEFGRTTDGPVIGAHSWFQVRVHKNLNLTIVPTSRPPQAIEYGTVFTGQGTVCEAPATGGTALCGQGQRVDLKPPAAKVSYRGGDDLTNGTTMSLFVIANFSEVLLQKVEFPRTAYPHATGSVERMARVTSSLGGYQLKSSIIGSNGSSGVSQVGGSEWEGSVEWPGFQVMGANNPALFFAFYSCGVFSIWNENWIYQFPGNHLDGRPAENISQVLEMTMLPRRNEKGLRPGEGEWWIGGDAPSTIGDDGVAAGDQAYLTQVQISGMIPPEGQAANEVLEDQEFILQLRTYTCMYPRARCQQKYLFVPDVTIFAEAIPISGIMATNRKDFKRHSKVLLNAVSDQSTESQTRFPNLKFSQEGDEGVYRIRVYAEGRWHHDSELITVRTRVNVVLLRLPASVQLKWPGCNSFMTIPFKDENGDGNPDSDFPVSQETAICFNAKPFVPLTDLPYVEAYECSVSQGKLEIQSLVQSCDIVTGKRLKMTINTDSSDPFSGNKNGDRVWTWPKDPTDLTLDRDVTELSAVGFQQKIPVVEPKHEIASLTINHMFKQSMYLSLSVGGVVSPMKIAISMNDTSTLDKALGQCMWKDHNGELQAPTAHIEIVDASNFEEDPPDTVSTVYPGMYWSTKVFATDMYGAPAKYRPICMRLYELDWHDYFADKVKLHDDYTLLRKEQERNPTNTINNFTYYNHTCWWTDENGIANVETWWDMQEVKFRIGPFAYYFESAEWEDNNNYKRQGSRWWILDPVMDVWKAKTKERNCLASFDFHIPNARTASYYVYMRQSWAESPTQVFGTARWPQLVAADLKSYFPQRGSYYGRTDRRTVEVGKPVSIYVRLYQGAAASDFAAGSGGVYPKGITCTSYLISGPPNFPKDLQRCYQNEPSGTSACYRSEDFEMTKQVLSDDYGYCEITFKAQARYLGVFTVLIAVGDSQFGQYSISRNALPAENEFSQTFEIEVVPFRGLPAPSAPNSAGAGKLGPPGCDEAAANIADGATGLAPNLKYFDFCPNRNPDGSCAWTTALCPPQKPLLTLIGESLLGDPPASCIPLGTAFPNALTVLIKNDLGESVSGFAFSVHGGPNSESLAVHPSISQKSDSAGKAVANDVVLDFAVPGLHQLQLSMKFDGIKSPAFSIVTESFKVTDELVATFLRHPPTSVVIGHDLDPVVTVELRIRRRCTIDVLNSAGGSGNHDWMPPMLSLRVSSVVGHSHNASSILPLTERWNFSSSVLLEGSQATPTFDNPYVQVATARFSGLKILAGLQGNYQFHVSVRGTEQVLASSLPFDLIRQARSLELLDLMPAYPNADLTHMIRVRALSAIGLPVESAFINVNIEPRNKDDSLYAGLVTNSSQNVSGRVDPVFAKAITGRDGIAMFSIVFRYYVYPGQYVLKFTHKGSPDLFSSTFTVISPIKELEMMSNPASDPFIEKSLVWPDLKASFPVPSGFQARKIEVQENPAGMKGSIQGEHVDDIGPVIRIKDHRGFAIIGHDISVKLIDYQNQILDKVVSASRGLRLTTDWGLSKDLPICNANGSRYDCDGLYVFDRLALENDVKSGFYRLRFECQGLAIVQGIDMVFMNAYLPNILRLNLWMYLSMGTCGCCLLLFQLNRLDRLVFQKYTAKYLQSAEERFLLGVIGTAGIAGFGWCSYLFYVTLRQSKTPPHEPDGYMLPTDEMANWSTWILYILVLISCVYSFYVMSGSRDKFSLVSSERFLQKLGMNAKVAETRRTFISKIPKKIDRPPRITAARGRFGKKLEKYKNKLRDLEKVWKILYRIAAAAYMEAKQVYVRIKYANPAFKSLYFAWPDVSYGIRFRTALILNTLLIVGSCLIGLWFDDYFSAVLTKYYATYISMVLDAGMKDRDWFDEIWTNKGGLGTLQQVVVIFFARSSKQGAPFFLHFLESFRYASIFSTMSATFIILARITIMGIEQRTTICNLRMGLVKKEIGNVKSIRLIDGCSYLGSQAILMFFGWFAFYVFAYTGVFALSWNTTRRILFRLWFPMAVVSIFLYMCSFWLARTRFA